jgi:uncharacterized protein YdbL (DUF1318 family)
LIYRLPREPSTPRISVWRRLKRLGVAQLGDGLVALPADARTREQLEWVAELVTQGGGSAGVWLARPATAAQERDIARQMATARAEEYEQVAAAATTALATHGAARIRVRRRLRQQLRDITRRDFFPPLSRDDAQVAVRRLATAPLDGVDGVDEALEPAGGSSPSSEGVRS